MESGQMKFTCEQAKATDGELGVTTKRGDHLFALVVEVRTNAVLLAVRGSVVERPLLAFEDLESVRLLPAKPSAEALRRLQIERRKADQRRDWVAQRDAEKRAEWAKERKQ